MKKLMRTWWAWIFEAFSSQTTYPGNGWRKSERLGIQHRLYPGFVHGHGERRTPALICRVFAETYLAGIGPTTGEIQMAKKVLLVGSVAILFSACTPNSQSVEAQRARVADGARVEMRDANKKTVGTLTVSVQSGGGVRFNGRVSDLPPGGHGVHIHENGKCDPPDSRRRERT